MGVGSYFVSFWNFVVSVSACAFTFYIVCQLLHFVSSHDHIHFSLEAKTGTISSLCWDTILVALFCVQHTGMCSPNVAKHLENKFGVLTRAAYVIATCLCLKILMHFWSRNDTVLWELNTASNSLYWWCFTALHFACWTIICTGSLLLDIGELLGAKQVYYEVASLYQPRNVKAPSLNRFYSHMRHPSFTAFALLFFVHPVMRLDRFLLGCLITVYVFLRFDVDARDYEYVRELYESKRRAMALRLG